MVRKSEQGDWSRCYRETLLFFITTFIRNQIESWDRTKWCGLGLGFRVWDEKDENGHGMKVISDELVFGNCPERGHERGSTGKP